MELEPDFVQDAARFERTFSRFVSLSTRSMEDEMRNQGRLFVLDLIRVTPPFHQGAGQNASTAKMVGQRSVRINIDKAMAGKDLVGSRRITHLFGKTDAPGLPFVVPAPEKHPNVQGIYDQAKQAAKSRGRRDLRFGKQSKRYVSRVKKNRVERAEVKKVGWAGGGWNDAAQGLGAGSKVPAFIRRHSSSPGSLRIEFKPTVLRIVMENRVGYVSRIGKIRREAAFALKKRTNAMALQIPRLIRAESRALRG
jgi:hypothetical protein